MSGLKFRAWHLKQRKMYNVAILYSASKAVVMQNGGRLFYRSLDEVELMQYTGLKDKHDKEVYEGDIVEYLDNTSQGLVKKTVTIEDIRYLPDFTCSKWQEVIGNIYQHPHLLSKETAP